MQFYLYKLKLIHLLWKQMTIFKEDHCYTEHSETLQRVHYFGKIMF